MEDTYFVIGDPGFIIGCFEVDGSLGCGDTDGGCGIQLSIFGVCLFERWTLSIESHFITTREIGYVASLIDGLEVEYSLLIVLEFCEDNIPITVGIDIDCLDELLATGYGFLVYLQFTIGCFGACALQFQFVFVDEEGLCFFKLLIGGVSEGEVDFVDFVIWSTGIYGEVEF